MCRLILTNRKDFYTYDKAHGILSLMAHLERECGGHGNGYALLKDGKVIKTRKGVKLSNLEIYRDIRDTSEWDWVIYHTRIVSSGIKKDEQCHPFVDDNHNVFAMNGTMWELDSLAETLDTLDTEIIFRLTKDMPLDDKVRALAEMDVIFVGASRGVPFAVKGSGDLCRFSKGCGTFHASSFPAGVAYKTMERGYIWADGAVVRERKAPTACTGTAKGLKTGYWNLYDDEDWNETPQKYKPASDLIEETQDAVWDDMLGEYVALEESPIFRAGYEEGFTQGLAEGKYYLWSDEDSTPKEIQNTEKEGV